MHNLWAVICIRESGAVTFYNRPGRTNLNNVKLKFLNHYIMATKRNLKLRKRMKKKSIKKSFQSSSSKKINEMKSDRDHQETSITDNKNHSNKNGNSIVDFPRGRLTFSNETFNQKIIMMVIVVIFLSVVLYFFRFWIFPAWGISHISFSSFFNKGRSP